MIVKICGITRPVDAAAAVAAGANAIGLNFVRGSRRYLDPETARLVLAVVPEDVLTVGIFWEHTTDEVVEIAEALGLGAAQLHGDHPPAYTATIAEAVGTVIKVVPADRLRTGDVDDHAAGILMVDGPIPGAGAVFDWAVVGDLVATHKVLLAGGLRPDNVGDAIEQVRPWGVDVASGVELEPAIKDHRALARFVTEAHAAGDRLTQT